jgi:predicted ArsR family transcriptional regulator
VTRQLTLFPLPPSEVDARRSRIADLWAAGWTGEEIAEEVEITPRQVWEHLRALRSAGDSRVPHRPQWTMQARNRMAAQAVRCCS